jgi:isoleucyl-tRNA synthetase
MDEWVLSRLNTVIEEVTKSLDAYDVTKGARLIAAFLDEVSNWYIRRSRQRFWSSGMNDDKKAAFHTLYEVLTKTAQLMAPFAPFISEEVYLDLVGESVHLSDFPKTESVFVNKQLEEKMQAVLQVVELTRSIRNAVGIKTKQPLSQLTVLPVGAAEVRGLDKYESIIADETNVKQVHFAASDSSLVTHELKLNFPVAGPKLGKKVGEVQKYVTQLSKEETSHFLERNELELTLKDGVKVQLTKEDILVETSAKPGYAFAAGDSFRVLLQTEITEQLKEEGFVREVVRAVQMYRKQLNLPVELRVELSIGASEHVQMTLKKFEAFLHENLIIKSITFERCEAMETFTVEGEEVCLRIK